MVEIFRTKITGAIVSSAGYEVKGLGRSTVRYKDAHVTLDISADLLVARPFGYAIYVDKIPELPHLSRQELINRIWRAFRSVEGVIEFYDLQGRVYPSTTEAI